jgi:hypothetical protein
VLPSTFLFLRPLCYIRKSSQLYTAKCLIKSKAESTSISALSFIFNHIHLKFMSYLDLRTKVDLYNDHLWNLHSKKEQMDKEMEEKKKRLLFLSVADNV